MSQLATFTYLTVDHGAVHPSCGRRSNSLPSILRFGWSGTTAFEPTCLAIRRWPRCRARGAVGAAAAPPVLAPSCNALRTMALPRRQRSPDRPDKTFVVWVLSSYFERLPASRLNQSTDQKLGGQALRRRRLRVLERSNITLVATLMRHLVVLRHHENVVVD